MMKELEELAGLAVEQGWVVKSGNNHAKWYPPEDAPNRPKTGFFTTSMTPSDTRIIRTIRNQFEKTGLVTDRSQWKRERKAIRAEIDSRNIGANALTTLEPLTDEEIEGVIQRAAGDRISSETVLAATVQAFKDYKTFAVYCTCGQSFEQPIHLLVHLATRHLKEEYSHQPIHGAEHARLMAREEAIAREEGLGCADTTPESSAPSTHRDGENSPENAEKTASILATLTATLEMHQSTIERLQATIADIEESKQAIEERIMLL